ncbi:MAG: serine hydrolase [Bacteroidota bacterium]
MKYLSLTFSLFSFFLMSTAQIPQQKAVDSIFAKWSEPGSPGGSLGIIQDGKLIYAKGYGLANLEYDLPNTEKSVFRIGSTSKQFTAACIVLLAEQGKLSLEDKLSSFFPDFPPYADTITVSHLLHHTSGIRDYLQLSYLKGLRGDDYYTDKDIMKWLVNQSSLNFSPGDEFVYSNSGYWLLGQIVNKASGMNMAEFAQKEIFEPLGMNETHFHNDHDQIVKNRASGYAPKREGGYRISMTTLDMIGDGGIFTTIEDIKKWDDAYYESKVLSKEFWAKMTEKNSLNSGKETSYAAGLFIDTHKGLNTVSHGGAFVGFRAELLRFPDQRFTVAIFANRADASPSRMAYQVADIFLKDLYVEEKPETEEPEAVAPNDPEYLLEQLTGNYEIEPGVEVKISIEKDSLFVTQLWNEEHYAIFRTEGNTFSLPTNSKLTFTFTELEENLTQKLTVSQGGRKTVTKRKAPVDLSELKLSDYVGAYYSKELDATYHLELQEGELMARIGEGKLRKCRFFELTTCDMPMGTATFEKAKGKVTKFMLDSGRVKNLAFEKQ